MKRRFSQSLLSLCAVLFLTGFYGCLNEQVSKIPQKPSSGRGLIDYVDTRAGSGGVLWASGHTSPAAGVPHGLVKLGPDTVSFGRILSTSGYSYSDTQLLGFSHTRYSGSGVWEGGILRVKPITYVPSYEQARNYRAHFTHENESATPGYYAVYLTNYKVLAEMTATTHVGLHRYQFAENIPSHLLIELSSRLSANGKVKVHEARLSRNKDELSGWLTLYDDFSNRYQGQPFYFIIRWNHPLRAHRFLYPDKIQTADSTSDEESSLYLHLEFDSVQTVEVKVALSHVSLEGARLNLQMEVEAEEKSFDQVRQAGESLWESLLSRVRIESEDENAKKIFYQSLYRSFLMPSIVSDAKALGTDFVEYRGFDKQVHRARGFAYYAELSLWDTFRTVHPLYNLIASDIQSDVLESLLAMARQSGRLPRWAGAGGHADSMLGFAGNIVVSESYQKGVGHFDPEEAFELMKKTMTGEGPGRECLKDYIEYGYCPMDRSQDSVSLTLEYSYADYTMALMAEKLGKIEEARYFEKRSNSYKNLWDPSNLAFVPRSTDGSFEKDFYLLDNSYLKASKAAAHYREGSPNQWRWYVPWDIKGLTALFEGDFFLELERFFKNSPQVSATLYPGGYYWHGNEPDIHAAFLFALAGKPELTQKWARWALETKYRATSDALEGDDDCGTLSSWYVLTALGLFPIAGTDKYVLVTPRFPEARVTLSRGNRLSIRADPYSSQAIYSCGATLNGKPVKTPVLSHAEIAEGGALIFQSSEVPCAWR